MVSPPPIHPPSLSPTLGQVAEHSSAVLWRHCSWPWGKQMHLLHVNNSQEESFLYYFPPQNTAWRKPQLFVASHNACGCQVWLLKSVQLSRTWGNQATEVVGVLGGFCLEQQAFKCWSTSYKAAPSHFLLPWMGKPQDSLRNENGWYFFIFSFILFIQKWKN